MGKRAPRQHGLPVKQLFILGRLYGILSEVEADGYAQLFADLRNHVSEFQSIFSIWQPLLYMILRLTIIVLVALTSVFPYLVCSHRHPPELGPFCRNTSLNILPAGDDRVLQRPQSRHCQVGRLYLCRLLP